MKKFHIILLFLFGISLQLSAQKIQQKNELIAAIVGKWKVIKYQSQSGTQSKADVLIFESDGTFKSDSIYFTTKDGLFRTDETQTVLILENGNTTTEWTTSLKNGVLRMRSVPKNKQPKIHITAVRVKDEV
jgi:hypothetical protein